MFLFMLGGTVALAASLFVAPRTAIQIIGWLFVLAALAGAVLHRGRRLGEITAATVALGSGLVLLYVAHFEWSEVRVLPGLHAATQARPLQPKAIQAPAPALAAALGMNEIVVPPMPKAQSEMPLLAIATLASPATAMDSCSSRAGVESVQCRRCAAKGGFAWLICQERARLEYCEGRPHDQASCPSPVPQSYPG
jgi:hypothetical protein